MNKKNLLFFRLFNIQYVYGLLASVFLTSSAALGQNVVTPQHIAEMETVTSSQLSPDGEYIAYTVSTPADPYVENVENSIHLYLLNVSEGTTTPYFTTGSVSSVQFRPGQEAITFLTKRPGDETRSIYQVPVTGGEAVKIFSFDQDILSYSWHDDGNQIAFMAFEKAEESDSPLPYSANVFEENKPQQRGYITNIAMTSRVARKLPVDGSVYNMVWSPEGDRLAVSVAPTPFVDDQLMNQQIIVVDANNGEISAEINNKGKLDQIEWSPNGQRLALLAGSNINDPTAGRIMIVTSRGGVPQIIDRQFRGAYDQIEWIEENYIHFLASESTASRIGKLRFDSGEKLTSFYSDEHHISSFSISDSTTYTFIASRSNHPGEVFYFSGEENDMHERMTYHNEWLNSVELGEQVVVSYQTRDGEYEIDGLLIYPVGYEENSTVPVIVHVHGGPESHYNNGWLTNYYMPGQVAAGKGYAVFYPNYRGSTGRGIDFAFSSQADIAGAEFNDIIDGVDFLIKIGIADPNRIGITGKSYGGYAAAWMSTYYSSRFAASVMYVGVSDNISKWGESDIPEELYLVHTRKRLWNDWSWFLRRSPIYHVANAQTPILIIHGADDTRVHPSQSLELYRHLKVRKPNLPVRLVNYPGEGHTISSASAKLDYNYRMFRWLDTYLMTGNTSAEKPHWDAPIPGKE
ncbi:MAG: S9 family peptidase [Balneolaceae bacterium]|nr:S9 family peptidase [Balneolaceae bacterium]